MGGLKGSLPDAKLGYGPRGSERQYLHVDASGIHSAILFSPRSQSCSSSLAAELPNFKACALSPRQGPSRLDQSSRAQTSSSASDRGLDLASCQWKRRTDVHPPPRAGHQRTRMGNPCELAWVTCGSAPERSDPKGDVGGEENSSAGWNRLHACSDPWFT